MGLKKAAYGTNVVLMVLLLAGILGVVNAFSYRHFFRADLTENKRFTISESTRQMLSDLDDIVNIKVYLSKDLPPYMVTVTSQIKDIIAEYEIYGEGNIAVEYIDPTDDPMLQRKLRFMGIPQLRLNIIEKNQAAMTNVYMGLAVLYGDNKEVIPALTDTVSLEYDLTSKILRVTRDTVETIGFLTGHGEPGLHSELSAINGALKEQYWTKTVSTEGGKPIPDDIAALVVASPRKLTDRDLFEIDQYVMSGGKALFLIDRVDINQQRGLQGQLIESPVTDLLEHWGVKVLPELVLDKSHAQASFQSGMFNIMVPYPFWVRILRQSTETDHPIISRLESMVLPWPSPLEVVADNSSVSATVIAQTTEHSWTQKGYFNLNPQQPFQPSPGSLTKRTVAVELSGRFDSFFTGKAVPEAELKDNDNATATEETAGQDKSEPGEPRTITAKSPETQIIVVGNARFITGQFPARFEGNRSFFLNAMDWFILGDYLMDIRSREAGERPLHITSDSTKTAVRYINLLAVPAALAVFGLFQAYARRRRKRRGIVL